MMEIQRTSLLICLLLIISLNTYSLAIKATDSPGAKVLLEGRKADSLLYRKGKKLFTAHCSSCHSAGSEIVVGPGLAGITKRQSETRIREWIRNSVGLLENGDKYSKDLFRKYNNTLMPHFTTFTNQDIEAILVYIDGNYKEKHLGVQKHQK